MGRMAQEVGTSGLLTWDDGLATLVPGAVEPVPCGDLAPARRSSSCLFLPDAQCAARPVEHRGSAFARGGDGIASRGYVQKGSNRAFVLVDRLKCAAARVRNSGPSRANGRKRPIPESAPPE